MPPFPYCQRTSPYCQRTISALPTSLFLPSGLSFLYYQHTIPVLPTPSVVKWFSTALLSTCHSCIVNMPVPYCQYTQCCHMVINSLIVNAPFLYCQYASSVLSPHHSALPTHQFLPSGLPFPFRKPGSRLMPIRKEEPRNTCCMAPLKKKKAVTYSPALHCSTIGASGLNFSVRNGKRWDTTAIAT